MWAWLVLLARLTTGGVWIAAGWLKLPDPAGSVRAVRAYQLLPEAIVPTVGYALPILEIIIGALLVVGLLTRPAAVVSGLLFLVFIVGISSAWSRGLKIDCGCFGGGGYDANATAEYPWEIARDVGLLALSALLVWRPRGRFALDSVVFAEPASAYDETTDPAQPAQESAALHPDRIGS